MPRNAEVHICHGKYLVAGICKNRKFRLVGLQEQLSKEGHTPYLHDTSDLYEVTEIKVNEEVVHQCKVTDFQFGGDGELDPLCKIIVDKVNTAY
uniref:CST complex subunit TEN1 n=1 Tax=Schistosoma mansoni TaxID=6183 RepID=A0A5K4F5V8_SCHMA